VVMTTATSLSVLVLGGGPDAEREVSLKSAAAVAAALRRAGHQVSESDIGPEDATPLDVQVDVIFPVLHGPFGEGGPLQQMLETRGLPYVGCGPEAATTAMDKVASKVLAEQLGIPTPPSQVVSKSAGCQLPPPLVLKPIDSGSSDGVVICMDAAQVSAALPDLLASYGRVLAEAFIPGAELTVGILDDQALPPIQIVPAVDFYDYDAKYDRNDTDYRFEIDLPRPTLEAITRHSGQIHEALGCRHLSRVDFLVDDQGQPWFLEINTMPGFTDHSLLPMAAAHTGISMDQLCDRLVRLALQS
jgi:D-alanine-D-alanine ligase